MKRYFFALAISLITATCVLSSGCWLRNCEFPFVPTAPRIQSSSRPVADPIRRIALMPTSMGRAEQADFALLINQQLANTLRATGKFEVIVISHEQLEACQNNVIRQGRYDERQLARLGRQFNVDGVFYSKLKDSNIYGPLSADLNCVLVDVREAIVVSSVNGRWDLGHPADRNRFLKFGELTHHEYPTPDIAENSPRMMAGFIAAEVAIEVLNR